MEELKVKTKEVEEQHEIKYHVIGSRPVRPDGTDKVTGRAQYGADVNLPGMLYGAILRSPHAHARIVSIDTSEAESIEGVKAIATADDLPNIADRIAEVGEGAVNIRYRSNNVMARDKVLYEGHPVAAVAANTLNIAKSALHKIKVSYEILPHVLNVRDAMKNDAPILLEELRTKEMGKEGKGPTNIARHFQLKHGDIEQGFQKADVIVEREFNTSTVHQGYIEPTTATALYNNDGQITIWTSTQGSFLVQQQVSDVLMIPVSKIKVVPMEIGGGFGGKTTIYLDPVAVVLSKKSGFKPVKMTMSRSEVLKSTGPTSGSHINIKIGATNSGKLTAVKAELAYEAGAFPGSPVGAGAAVIFAPYKFDNLQIDGYDVVVNKPRAEPYRAPGGTNAAFAGEAVIDELCFKLGIDPIEFRLMNAVEKGDRRADGPTFDRIGYRETLEAAQNHPHYDSDLGGDNRGRGVASGFWFNYGGKSSASASVNSDGTINLIEGSTDIGGSRASIAMQFAESLEIPIEDIRVQVTDTSSVGYTEGTYGSRTTYSTGWAAYNLGQDIKTKLIERASMLFDVNPPEISYSNGVFSNGDQSITFKELAKRLDETGSPVIASTSVKPKKAGPGFATHIVDVEVDPETCKVDILRYTAVQDVGKAIHPSYVEGQIQGGVVQGIGWALNEEYIYNDKGQLLNDTLLDYRMPTSYDVPMIDTVLVEVPDPDHPYGVRGVGEVPIVPPPAAIANAIYRAVGKRMDVLPMSPQKIFDRINRKE